MRLSLSFPDISKIYLNQSSMLTLQPIKMDTQKNTSHHQRQWTQDDIHTYIHILFYLVSYTSYIDIVPNKFWNNVGHWQEAITTSVSWLNFFSLSPKKKSFLTDKSPHPCKWNDCTIHSFQLNILQSKLNSANQLQLLHIVIYIQ